MPLTTSSDGARSSRRRESERSNKIAERLRSFDPSIRERARRDEPVQGLRDAQAWGSDAIADMLRALDIPYVLVNPGASFRGLHDSLVNHLGNLDPQMLLVLHEEHAVAIAHGYAKVTGRPLAAVLHSNVGLMHGSMDIFDAWADRVPVLVLGVTGPVDAAQRRPWIDWLHTAADQAALVRPFIKWDAQPASVPAAQEALLRAHRIATTAPRGPVYVCFDAALHEARLEKLPELPVVSRYQAPQAVAPAAEDVATVVRWLGTAKQPVILAGRADRTRAGWDQRVALSDQSTVTRVPLIVSLEVFFTIGFAVVLLGAKERLTAAFPATAALGFGGTLLILLYLTGL